MKLEKVSSEIGYKNRIQIWAAKLGFLTVEPPLWKFNNFPATLILHKINFKAEFSR